MLVTLLLVSCYLCRFFDTASEANWVLNKDWLWNDWNIGEMRTAGGKSARGFYFDAGASDWDTVGIKKFNSMTLSMIMPSGQLVLYTTGFWWCQPTMVQQYHPSFFSLCC
jgi:hypothetical protein